ncbi:hypothetical protein Dimus_011179 [Dionaea muscipula]
MDAQDHPLESKDPEIQEEKEAEVDVEASEEDLSRSRLQAESMEDMHSEEDWVMFMVVADYQIYELIDAEKLLKLFKVSAALHKVGEMERKKDDEEKRDDDGDHDGRDDDDGDDNAPHGGEKEAHDDMHDRHKEDEKAVEDDDDDDDDVPTSSDFHPHHRST